MNELTACHDSCISCSTTVVLHSPVTAPAFETDTFITSIFSPPPRSRSQSGDPSRSPQRDPLLRGETTASVHPSGDSGPHPR